MQRFPRSKLNKKEIPQIPHRGEKNDPESFIQTEKLDSPCHT